jgi:hypothetical protein
VQCFDVYCCCLQLGNDCGICDLLDFLPLPYSSHRSVAGVPAETCMKGKTFTTRLWITSPCVPLAPKCANSVGSMATRFVCDTSWRTPPLRSDDVHFWPSPVSTCVPRLFRLGKHDSKLQIIILRYYSTLGEIHNVVPRDGVMAWIWTSDLTIKRPTPYRCYPEGRFQFFLGCPSHWYQCCFWVSNCSDWCVKTFNHGKVHLIMVRYIVEVWVQNDIIKRKCFVFRLHMESRLIADLGTLQPCGINVRS